MNNPISILKSLVKINTESSKSNLSLIYFIQKILNDSGFKARIQKVKVGSVIKANLIAKIGKGSGGLLLSGHTDTVPFGSNWKTDPLKLTKKNNHYYGLGAVDMKGSLAAIIIAAGEKAKQKKIIKKPLTLVFTFDEEAGFLGIRKLFTAKLEKPDLAVVCEPTNMLLALAHRGVVALEIKIIGKEFHSGNPSLGVNAIEIASDFIGNLNKEFMALGKNRDLVSMPLAPTICVTKIKGGSAINKVPGSCSLELEYRPVSQKDVKDIYERINNVGKKIIKNKKDARINIKRTFFVSPFDPYLKPKLVSSIKKIARGKSISVSYSSEASVYQQHGISSIVLGPGDIKRAHKPNEFIQEKELSEAITIYEKLIKKFCF